MLRNCAFGLALILLSSVGGSAAADEGMWLFNDLPVTALQSRYGFTPNPRWTEHLMKSSVRFNVGGSGSFISSNGLVLTNHHVASDTLFKLSDEQNNYLDDGFLARTLAEELRAPDLELNQLVEIEDVTARVSAAVLPEMSTQQAVAARRAIFAEIEQESLEQTGLQRRGHAVRRRQVSSVPLQEIHRRAAGLGAESAIAFFGGDADNFEYPRYCLDACIFGCMRTTSPAPGPLFAAGRPNRWRRARLVFVSGHPGRTNRIYTAAALEYQRDKRMPYMLNLLRRREITLQQFGLRGPESARRAKEDLFGIQNSRKAYLGMLGGLQDPPVMAAKRQAEAELRGLIEADAAMAGENSPFAAIDRVQLQRGSLLGKNVTLYSQLFRIARTIVELVEEDPKPSGERLPEYADAGRESLEQQLYSTAPIYDDLEAALLADSLSLMLEARGADDPLCQLIMQGKNPTGRAAELVTGTQLHDPALRRQLVLGGAAAVSASQDAMIRLAAALDADNRHYRKIEDDLAEEEKQAYGKIAESIFKARGTSVYPDATFTLRLAFGTVVGYEQAGQPIPPWTTIGGAFAHETAHAGQADFVLPASWQAAQSKLDPQLPMNFVSTADIIGGNSGSPVVNREGQLVGLIFDGNIQSLVANYLFDERQMRATSVASLAIEHALRRVYQASELADQLGR